MSIDKDAVLAICNAEQKVTCHQVYKAGNYEYYNKRDATRRILFDEITDLLFTNLPTHAEVGDIRDELTDNLIYNHQAIIIKLAAIKELFRDTEEAEDS